VTDASSDPTPWRLAAAGCGAYSTSGHAGTPRGCQGAVTHAGLILREHPVQAWLAFSCSMHTDDLIAARPLLDRDRAVLADWRARERRALDGQGWDRLGRWPSGLLRTISFGAPYERRRPGHGAELSTSTMSATLLRNRG
jgi:hypothetical protein